jgi:hypothetical protein
LKTRGSRGWHITRVNDIGGFKGKSSVAQHCYCEMN